MRAKCSRLIWSLLFAVLVGPAFAAPNIVTNGGFESGLSGWTANVSEFYLCSPGPDSCNTWGGFQATGAPHSGTNAALLGPSDIGSFFQILSTTAGSAYDISFWVANCQDYASCNPNSLSVAFGATTVMAATSFTTGFGWTQYTFDDVVATTNSTTLSFSGMNSQSFLMFDDISVTLAESTSVPLPGTLGLLGIAGLVASWARRRRAA